MLRFRKPILLAALCFLPLLAQTTAPVDPALASPRATFDTFLSAMVDVKTGSPKRIDDAVKTLDLDSLPALLKNEGPRLARDLKNYLDRVELIDVSALPTEVDERYWIWRKNRAGEVSLVRTDDGRWLFSQQTLESLSSLLDSVRDRDFVEGIEGGGGAPRSVADLIRARMPDSMAKRTFLLENWQWLALLVLVVVGVIVDRLVRLLAQAWIGRILSKSKQWRQKSIDADFTRPLGILAMALFWRALLPLFDLPLKALTAFKFATELMMAAAAVWAVYRLVDLIAAHLLAMAKETDTKIDDILVPMVRRAIKIVVVAFGLLFIASNLDIDITSLLAGLGLGGLAFALAAKDTIENLFGSLTVLIDRPFQIGDWVVLGDVEGTVEEIGFRTTRVRTFYNSQITVPNSNLVSASVDNLGRRMYRRVKTMLSVQYDTPPERLEAFCEGIRELIRKHPYTRKDYYMVYFNEFAGSSLNVLLYAFFDTPDWPTELREKHRLFVDIVRLAHRLGIDFAFPTQTIHVASMAETGAQPPQPGVDGDALVIGRKEAEAIMAGRAEAPQPPVGDFGDPSRMPARDD